MNPKWFEPIDILKARVGYMYSPLNCIQAYLDDCLIHQISCDIEGERRSERKKLLECTVAIYLAQFSSTCILRTACGCERKAVLSYWCDVKLFTVKLNVDQTYLKLMSQIQQQRQFRWNNGYHEISGFKVLEEVL